jgi:hypothetical protein
MCRTHCLSSHIGGRRRKRRRRRSGSLVIYTEERDGWEILLPLSL